MLNFLENKLDKFHTTTIGLSFLTTSSGFLYFYLFNKNLFLELDYIKLIFLSWGIFVPFLIGISLLSFLLSLKDSEIETKEGILPISIFWFCSSIVIKYFFNFKFVYSSLIIFGIFLILIWILSLEKPKL
jgi:hypothetical protein